MFNPGGTGSRCWAEVQDATGTRHKLACGFLSSQLGSDVQEFRTESASVTFHHLKNIFTIRTELAIQPVPEYPDAQFPVDATASNRVK